ncbi:MAG: hypothetical protein WKG07_47475 [Hymenobacter sp.]
MLLAGAKERVAFASRLSTNTPWRAEAHQAVKAGLPAADGCQFFQIVGHSFLNYELKSMNYELANQNQSCSQKQFIIHTF